MLPIKNKPDDLEAIPEASQPTKRTKLANIIAAISLVLAAAAVTVFLGWSVADPNVLEIHNSPFPARVVKDPTGQTGGIVFLKADYCKNSDLVGEVRMSYISKSREVFLPLAQERLPKGCADREIPVIIPLNLLKDEYVIKFRVTYDLNPVKQDATVLFESQPVIVGSNGVGGAE